MRAKPMLWGAAVAIALVRPRPWPMSSWCKSLGPSAKAYPPGKTLPPSAKITLQGGDIVTVLGPSRAQDPARSRQFRRRARSASRRRPASAAASARCAPPKSRTTRASGTSTSPRAARCASSMPRSCSCGGRTATAPARSRSARPTGKARSSAGQPASRSPPGRPRCRSQTALQYQIEWRETGDKSSLDVVTVGRFRPTSSGTAKVLIENGCQNQLDLLVSSASKAK